MKKNIDSVQNRWNENFSNFKTEIMMFPITTIQSKLTFVRVYCPPVKLN